MRVPLIFSTVRRSILMSGVKLRTLSRLKRSPKIVYRKSPAHRVHEQALLDSYSWHRNASVDFKARK